MAAGIVVLGPCSRLMRELLRSLFQQDSALQVVEGERPAEAGGRIVAHVVVGERERAEDVARAMGVEEPVVVVSPDGRWAGRVVEGRLERGVEDVTAAGVRGLVGE